MNGRAGRNLAVILNYQDMGAYAGAEHQIKEMNSVYVVTNKVWTESPVCPGDSGIGERVEKRPHKRPYS